MESIGPCVRNGYIDVPTWYLSYIKLSRGGSRNFQMGVGAAMLNKFGHSFILKKETKKGLGHPEHPKIEVYFESCIA